MRDAPLSPDALETAVSELNGWTVQDDALVRELKFADFRQAMAFVMRLAFEAEELNHHPELGNVYNRVSLRLTTHDSGNKVTARDVELATRADAIAGELGV